jgi:cysteine protease ATG4
VGIIGGRPNHALYFVGIVNDQLIYLDPHQCQNVIDLEEDDADTTIEPDDATYHCPFLLHMPFDQVQYSIVMV